MHRFLKISLVAAALVSAPVVAEAKPADTSATKTAGLRKEEKAKP